jgi:hypothetical protein
MDEKAKADFRSAALNNPGHVPPPTAAPPNATSFDNGPQTHPPNT